jgi:YD repeat-containing protein
MPFTIPEHAAQRVNAADYDALGRLTSVIADGAKVASYEYDQAGRLARTKDPGGLRSYEYVGDNAQRVGFEDTDLEIDTNDLRSITRFSNDRDCDRPANTQQKMLQSTYRLPMTSLAT